MRDPVLDIAHHPLASDVVERIVKPTIIELKRLLLRAHGVEEMLASVRLGRSIRCTVQDEWDWD